MCGDHLLRSRIIANSTDLIGVEFSVHDSLLSFLYRIPVVVAASSSIQVGGIAAGRIVFNRTIMQRKKSGCQRFIPQFIGATVNKY